MSRLPIPGTKSGNIEKYKKQVCIYAFTYNELESYFFFGKKSIIENFEDIEILRFFELDKSILMVETSQNSLAVDVPLDIVKVENAIREKLKC